MRSILKLPLAAAISLACLLGVIGPAHAGTPLGKTKIIETPDSRKTCDNPLIEHPFAKFRDYADYVLAPGGKFDGSITGWQLVGGAKLITTDKGKSLQLPKGASAISPAMCLDLNYPTFRMYHKVVKPKPGLVGGLLGGVLGLVLGTPEAAKVRVEVVYPQVAAPQWTQMTKFDGREGVSAGNGWRLFDPIDLKPELGGALPGARQAALRFTVLDAASKESVLIDDVYVDPMRR
jgi:hypothetical protein